jgi:hypothetical protein
MLLSAAAAPPPRTWAGLIALAAAYVIFRIGSWVWATVVKSPSPTRALPGVKRVKVQATVGVDTDRTDDTERGDPDWWGRIREIGGLRFRQVQQVVRTGSSDVPDDEGGDLALDDEPAEEPADDRPLEEPETYIARCRDLGVPYAHIVRVVSDHYGLTVDQTKYRIRKVDESRKGQAA